MDRKAEIHTEIRNMIDQERPEFVRRVNQQMRQEQPALDADLWIQGKEKEVELIEGSGLISRAWRFH